MERPVVAWDPVRSYFRALAEGIQPETVELNSSQEDAVRVARRIVCGSYCPVISCAALKTLYRQDRREVVDWLKSEWKPLLSSAIRQQFVVEWNQCVIAKWRLFESTFRVGLAWTGFDANASGGGEGGASYMFSLGALVSYYWQSAAFYSRSSGCSSCRGKKSRACSSDLVLHLNGSFPLTRSADECPFPDFSQFSEEQMAAWSLAVGFIGLTVVGRALGSHSVECYGQTLIAQWHLELEMILLGIRQASSEKGTGGDAPPSYPG
ncbi:hypothetical protein HIM_11650 [Hirsutella minnesotensis 3608]|uniref:Uncharacterized protein n=1 Tax=Hirsutella minnesotensis 3608 TaxID=1043627 RepID=A0A0F7ZR41_9HYPO|nr:hypothetical protein HIM_11650 [Hirsutella minnesotensis 3608]